IAKKGGEAFFQKRAGGHAHAVRYWVEKNGFVGMLIAALLPPPTPFKIFVLAAGVFEVPLVSFASAIALARAIRYFGLGYLAIRYGKDAMPFLAHHKLEVTIVVILFVLASYVSSRVKPGNPAHRRCTSPAQLSSSLTIRAAESIQIRATTRCRVCCSATSRKSRITTW